MRSHYHLRLESTRRPLAVVLTLLWMIAGLAPGLHHHEAEVAGDAHCHDSGLTVSTLLETQEPAHHKACGLCAKTLTFSGFERPAATVADEAVTERASESSLLVPQGPPGRDGASRAPPLA